MKKFQDLAAPDDPDSWFLLLNMWPTRSGTYETADFSTGTSITGGGASTACHYAYAFALDQTNGTVQEYVLLDTAGTPNLYSWDGTTLTSRASFGANPSLRGGYGIVNYGSAALVAAGIFAQKIKAATSFTNAFADIAGAPTFKNILAIQSNAVLAFTTNSNAWHVSDVGDYTNWSTGESASGTLTAQPGNIKAAISYGGHVYAFQPGAIHRFTYVGNTVKWQVQTAWVGAGIPELGSASKIPTQDWAVATQHGIAFYGGQGRVFIFDGVSPPVCINPYTTVPVESMLGIFTYNPYDDVLTISPSNGSSAAGVDASGAASAYYYYNFQSQAWGAGSGGSGEIPNAVSTCSGVVRGDYFARINKSSKPTTWCAVEAIGPTLKRNVASDPGSSSSCYLQTSKYGRADGKTSFNRVIPLLRRRTDLGTDSAALQLDLYREREDTSTTTSRSVTESTDRKRFDLMGGTHVDNFARIKVTWTALDVEVDDFLLKAAFTEDTE